MKKTVKIILFLICLAIFLTSSYKIFEYVKQKNASEKLNNKSIRQAVTEIQNPLNEDEENAPFSVDFSILKEENTDIVGWIYAENTPINYPVVQSEDNKYYLRRMINGSDNIEGSIFMDYRNSSDLINRNTILYGHNMDSGTMFGTLQKYKEQEYYDEHKEMYYFTPEKTYKLKLFAGYTISANSEIYDLVYITQDKIKEIINKSDFKSDVIIEEEDKFLTLSTCSYEYEDARYVVMGILQ